MYYVDYISWSIWRCGLLCAHIVQLLDTAYYVQFHRQKFGLYLDYINRKLRVPHGGNRETTLNIWVHDSARRTHSTPCKYQFTHFLKCSSVLFPNRCSFWFYVSSSLETLLSRSVIAAEVTATPSYELILWKW